MKLGVNIDHIATLRQARREDQPDPVTAALICELHGADGITCHLREDRRHIQDRDLHLLRKLIKTRLNLEMASNPETIGIAGELKPDQVTLVPERREEVTTEGGLDVKAALKDLKKVVKGFQNLKIQVSLFIDPEYEQIVSAAESGANAVELHTGAYARAFRAGNCEDEWTRLRKGAFEARRSHLLVFAGHGLDYRNVSAIRTIEEITEVNIGFSIVAQAVMTGLPSAVAEMKKLIRRI
ncbi:MAG: pyridoxine 5'-phosphate synthase [Candidatus Wallbacteria bacterium]|nr:pyridoxine 5'-phosphate synthase [Candidatus Wallbacteria bacterium]